MSSRRGVGRGAVPSGGGGGVAHVLAAMGRDIVASVSGDWQKSEDEGGIEKIDHHQRKLKSYSDDGCALIPLNSCRNTIVSAFCLLR